MLLTHRLFLPVAVLAIGLSASRAIWMRPDLNAPVDRLIGNTEERLKAAPESALLNYQLARLHSLAWAKEGQTIGVYSEDQEGFTFPNWETIRTKRDVRTPATLKEIGHLQDSLAYYKRAVTLAPENPLYAFGYAWMLEQVAPYSKVIKLAEGIAPEGGQPADFRLKALSLYRKAYELAKPADLKSNGDFIGVPEHFVSREAGEQIIRLVEKEQIGEFNPDEKADIQATKKELESRAKAITPIIFPVDGSSSFGSLINHSARVNFDLSGHDDGTKWPWVNRNAAFLAWDPQNTGRVTSGRQLFGTSTFWMFFRNGYDALASLDDNGDGWLKGGELTGISVWQDGNENAVSDPGEVLPASYWRVEAIRASHDQQMGDMPWSQTGLIVNGRAVSSYDWTPKSW